ncbi:arylamine N-acetyltransferase family protein [Aspergillus lucknowensis]|uniref:Arylamine N-acetyltransferase n=1 Tax=Aspergillus lucknowensis TaxID=176173 RepID=A0ABR4LQD4_9EURO
MTAVYTPDQLEAYLQRIKYANSTSKTGAEHPRLQQLQQFIQEDALAALTELQRRHLGSIPWGNSAIHYSQHHSISTHPSAVFEKLVVRRLDGYCMENTNLLYVVLRSLGYQAYPGAGRVSKTPANPNVIGADVRYAPLGHMVLIVTINQRRYMVDVGFGNNVPTRPLPLEENTITRNIAPTEMRLIKESLPESVDQSQKAWIYQIRFSTESDWIPIYAFTEMEFLPQDFAMMNFSTSKGSTSWFTQAVVCVQLLLDEAEGELQGLYILAGKEVKRRIHGNTEVVQTLQDEEDRVKALEKWFGMRLLDHEVAGIVGLGTEMK